MKDRNKLVQILLSSSLVFLMLGLFLYIFFTFWRTHGVEDIALDTRNTVLNLTTGEEHKLDDYSSMVFANDTIKYNTCDREIQGESTSLVWSRDWVYLMFFDSLHSEIEGDIALGREGEILRNSLYEQFTTDGVLELYTLWGRESYCLPYYLMKENYEYEKTFNLAKEICFDFYDFEVLESHCDNDRFCMNDEDFYSGLEDLFENGAGAEDYDIDDYSYFDDYYQNKSQPINAITDEFIVSYENDLGSSVNFTNATLFDAIHYIKFTKEWYKDMPTDPCLHNHYYYLGLLKAMSVKGSYLQNPSLIERHERLENEFLNICRPYYSNVLEEIISQQDYLGDRIEWYYLFEKNLDEDFITDLVADSLEERLIYRRINGSRMPFFDPVISESKEKGCFDVEIDLTKNLKSSFYMLYFNALTR